MNLLIVILIFTRAEWFASASGGCQPALGLEFTSVLYAAADMGSRIFLKPSANPNHKPKHNPTVASISASFSKRSMIA